MHGPRPQVPVEAERGAATERTGPPSPALAHHHRDIPAALRDLANRLEAEAAKTLQENPNRVLVESILLVLNKEDGNLDHFAFGKDLSRAYAVGLFHWVITDLIHGEKEHTCGC